MIWDRWDDAMDDLRDDEFHYKREIEKLEERLAKLGVKIPPWTPPEERPAGDHNDLYWNKSSEVNALSGRVSILQNLLAKELKKKKP